MTWAYDDRDDATDEAIARHQQQLIDWLARQGRMSRCEVRDPEQHDPVGQPKPDDKA